MSPFSLSRTRWTFLVVSSLGVAAVITFALGFVGGAAFSLGRVDGPALMGLATPTDRSSASVDADQRQALREAAISQIVGQRPLHAAVAAQAESFAVATGPIDSDVEGLYIMDSVSGDLQCVVLNFRTGKFNAVFRANVIQDLGLEDAAKRPTYLLATGAINFPRGATAARPGNSIVYVLDTTSGAYGAYGIPWRRELAATGRPQAAALLLLDVGRARSAALRE